MTEVTKDDYNIPLVQLDKTRGKVTIDIAGGELKSSTEQMEIMTTKTSSR